MRNVRGKHVREAHFEVNDESCRPVVVRPLSAQFPYKPEKSALLPEANTRPFIKVTVENNELRP